MNLSIIIPMYRIEKEIDDCLSSIFQQLLDYDVEILMINDGSDDRCGEIAQKYEKKDKRFHYYEKINGGLSDARNYGLQYATKKYIWFVDGDDMIAENAFTYLKNILQEEMDILYFDYAQFGAITKPYYIHNQEGYVSGHQYLLSPPNAWNKIIKHSLLKEHHFYFPKGIWYEDRAAMGQLVNWTKQIYYSKQILYRYRVREHSIMHQKNYHPKMLDIITAVTMMKDSVDQNQYYAECESNAIGNLLYQSAFRLLPFHKKEELNQCVDTCMKLYPHCEKNKYLLQRSKLYQFTIHNIIKKRYFIVNILRKIYQRGGV